MNKSSYLILIITIITIPFLRFASALPEGFTNTVLVEDLAWPTRITLSPDGRIFILEQAGAIRIFKNGELNVTPFATVQTDQNIISNGETGLLGIALHPDFPDTPFVYVNYTVMSPIHQRVSRFTATGDVADNTGETILLDIDNGNCHCGGEIKFGPDRKLYVSTGDASWGENAQSMSSLRGKILRMNPVADQESQIPADNPFYNENSGKYRLIWAYGLRNPWSFTFQPGTGRMFINDVGTDKAEEINEGFAGKNYGWPGTEGSFDLGEYPEYIKPIHAYGRDVGTDLTGGEFYNPKTQNFPAEYVGKYFVVDYDYESWIRYLDPESPDNLTEFFPRIERGNYLDVKIGDNGYLYYITRTGRGTLSQVSYDNGPVDTVVIDTTGVDTTVVDTTVVDTTVVDTTVVDTTIVDTTVADTTDSLTALPFYAIESGYSPSIRQASISYRLHQDVIVQLVIYNQFGKKVTVLENKRQQKGPHTHRWDLPDNCNSGLYFIRLKTGNKTVQQKLLVLR
ncbi:MAG: PQQ-dependent sugar dehydrogenase [Fibrobacteria bacterium]|nr:PQQ-dependent sugar dehydrogenase [Fibrobacteria bacterium]